MVLIRGAIAALVALVNLVVAPVGLRVDLPSSPPAVVLVGDVVTMDDDFTVIPQGRVLVRNGRIAAVWSGPVPPRNVFVGDATVVNAGRGALIFPGLINLHDHPGFDILPVQPPPSSHVQLLDGRPTGAEPYANRYQWNTESVGSPEYDRLVREPAEALHQNGTLLDESVKYAEVQSILGGETSLQGAGPSTAYDPLLARNIENGAFGRDRVDSRVPSVMLPSFVSQATEIRTKMALGITTAWLVHLAEGVRDGQRRPGDTYSSRAELDRLALLGLLNDTTVVLHGMGLERSDYATMRAAPPARLNGASDGLGAKLVWSPLSNLILYGATARITDAIAEDVTVSLGTDWTPSGSPNLLGELKVADRVLKHPDHPAGDPADVGLAGESLDRALVAMVTRNPAQAIRWDREVGTVEAGKVADLLVLSPPAGTPTPGSVGSPYRSLIDATERDVQLVLVGGDPLAGSPALMKQLKPGDHELIEDHDGTLARAVDVTNPAAGGGQQSLAQILTLLTNGLSSLGGVDGLEAIELPSLLTEDNVWWFDVLADLRLSLAWPFTPYPTNANHVLAGGNPFATTEFRDRWWPDAG